MTLWEILETAKKRPTGYFRVYYQIRPDFESNKMAYEALERERVAMGLDKRYINYNSFKANRAINHPTDKEV